MLLDELIDLEMTPSALSYDAHGYDLEGYRQSLATIGNPHSALRFIHVAGTKGKGSTVLLCESMLRGLRVRTATYTSPHVLHYGERYRFCGVPWSSEQFSQASAALVEQYGRDIHRTAFEFLTTLALVEFRRHAQWMDHGGTHLPHIVCWETGLGGRLDCTNVVVPEVSVLTTMGLDHTAILGDRIEDIATEKCGIIKPGVPVVVARQHPSHRDIVGPTVESRANELGAPVIYAERACPVTTVRHLSNGQEIELRLPDGTRTRGFLSLNGAFQQANIEVALAAVWHVADSLGLGINADALISRLGELSWPGRMELRTSSSGQRILIDGAHCPLSAEAVGLALVQNPMLRTPVHVVWGMQKDKDHHSFIAALLCAIGPNNVGCVQCYPAGGERGATAAELAFVASRQGVNAIAHSTLEEAIEQSVASGADILAVGSIRTVGRVQQCWLSQGESRHRAVGDVRNVRA